MSRAAIGNSGACQVRSGTANPCSGLAAVEILGVLFCERCAREQEVYFAIGELARPLGPERELKAEDLERWVAPGAGSLSGALKKIWQRPAGRDAGTAVLAKTGR